MRFGVRVGSDFVSTPMGFAGVFIDVKLQQDERAAHPRSQVGSATFERNVPVPTIGGIARGYADAVRFVHR